MSLVLRNIKGAKLTFSEMDNNFTYLESLSDQVVRSVFGRTSSVITSQNGDYDKDQISGLNDALDLKLDILSYQGFVGPDQKYLTIKEAIDDGKTLIEVVGDTTETSNIEISNNGKVKINIYQESTVDMGDNNFIISASSSKLYLSSLGNIIWSPQTQKHLFSSDPLNDTVLFIDNINLDMSGGGVSNCRICDGFNAVILTGIHQLDYPNQNGYGYHNSNPINFTEAFIVIRNIDIIPSNIYNCITVTGSIKNIVFVGVFSISNPIATINGNLELLTIIDVSGSGLTYNFTLNGGKMMNFQKLLLAGGSINMIIDITGDGSEIHNFNMIGDISSQINVNDYRDVYISNTSTDLVRTPNLTTRQNSVIDTSFSDFAYTRNIRYFNLDLRSDIECNTNEMIPIEDLTIDLESGWYRIDFIPFYDVKDISVGLGFNFQDSTALIANYSFSGMFPTDPEVTSFRNYDNPDENFTLDQTARLSNNRAYITAEFEVVKGGRITPHFRSETGDVVLLRVGTYLKYEKISIRQ